MNVADLPRPSSDLEMMRRLAAAAREDGRGLTPAERDRFLAAEERHLAGGEPAPGDRPEERLAEYEARAEAARYDTVFRNWLAVGVAGLPADQRAMIEGRSAANPIAERGGVVTGDVRALASLPGSVGGFAVSESFAGRVAEARKAVGGIRSAGVTVVRTSTGSDLQVPTDDDTSEGGSIRPENSQIAAQSTASDEPLDRVTLKAWTFATDIVKVSWQLIADAGIDLEAWLARRLGRRITRAAAPYLAQGDGEEEPQGLMTSSRVVVGHTASGTDTVTRAELVQLRASVDAEYARRGTWVISPGAETHLLGQATDGVPHFPEMLEGRILDRPYVVDQGLDPMETGKSPIAFGDLSAFWVREVGGLTVVRMPERFVEEGAVGFLAWHRLDSNVVAADSPVKKLVLA